MHELIAEIYDGLAKRAASLDDVAKFERRAADVRKNAKPTNLSIGEHISITRAANEHRGRTSAQIMKAKEERRGSTDLPQS